MDGWALRGARAGPRGADGPAFLTCEEAGVSDADKVGHRRARSRYATDARFRRLRGIVNRFMREPRLSLAVRLVVSDALGSVATRCCPKSITQRGVPLPV